MVKATRIGVAVAVAAGLALMYLKKKSASDVLHKKRLTKLRFDLSAGDIAAETTAILELWQATEDDVAMAESVTYEETAARLAQLDLELSPRISSVAFLRYVGVTAAIRDAATAAHQAISTYGLQSGMRADVYRVVKALADSAIGARLEGEKKRYVQRLVRDYERNGVHLEADAKARVLAAQKKLSALATAFAKNLNDDATEVLCSRADLAGVSEDVLGAMATDASGLHRVTMKYPIVFPVLQTCTVPETRRRVEAAFNSRCKDTNVAILEEMMRLRHEIATLLGFASHAAFIADVRMAKTPEKIRSFLTELNAKLTPLALREREALLALKAAECTARDEPFDGVLHMWDYRYYVREFEKHHCAVDHGTVQAYFPLEHVTAVMLEVFMHLLSLEFSQVSTPHVWHPDVRMYCVRDSRPGRHHGRIVGYFYLDLFPRPGKYSHAACHGLQASCVDTELKRQVPVAAMLANFTPATATKPSLLMHSEVVTLFHEFGHVMHQLCSEVHIKRFAGTAVERDFVEAPSQMLENWCWDPAVLRRLSRHHETGAPLPVDLIDRLVAAREACGGLANKRQLLFALFDQQAHAAGTIDTATLLEELHNSVHLVPMTPGTNLAASFGHIAGSYDAQYYGYLWSEVYAMDMFATRFQEDGLANAVTGLAYRETILARGGSVDAAEMVAAFLGRAPNDIAFLKSKGVL
ncbi:thimet oligopeptidase [Achlya hypogyna]|uniref:Thimet oligopeptidase n=1 Tax=Achlya hypogyna TaxID=1202772 RepID=A0A1V9ZU73_ACHHY|nr:thimet oligopeptidase [Achlya hypogyna]